MNKKKIPDNWLICEEQKDWHAWLTSHHDRDSEVWLQIKKAKSKQSGVTLGEAVEEAICFGWIDSMMFPLDADCYLVHMTPRKPSSMWSLLNKKRAESLIAMGRMTEFGWTSIREAQANGRWQAAHTSKARPDEPQDLKDALKSDAEAKKNYEKWPNSQKLMAVVWVEESKQSKTRINRIDKIVLCAHENKRLF